MAKTSVKQAARSVNKDELNYLAMGRMQPGGKLPLFDENGQEIKAQIIRACIDKGFAEPWFANPMKPNWLVCRLTEAGRQVIV